MPPALLIIVAALTKAIAAAFFETLLLYLPRIKAGITAITTPTATEAQADPLVTAELNSELQHAISDGSVPSAAD